MITKAATANTRIQHPLHASIGTNLRHNLLHITTKDPAVFVCTKGTDKTRDHTVFKCIKFTLCFSECLCCVDALREKPLSR